jgi:hypothetical protein
MSVFCECCVLLGRDLCDGLITRPEESYRLWCFVVCDQETSYARRLYPRDRAAKYKSTMGCNVSRKKNVLAIHFNDTFFSTPQLMKQTTSLRTYDNSFVLVSSMFVTCPVKLILWFYLPNNVLQKLQIMMLLIFFTIL